MTKDKLDVTIEYCHTCGDDLRAAWIAGEVLLHHGDYIKDFTINFVE